MNMRAVETDRQIDTDYRLEDRYLREDGAVFLTGTQALVRILIEQARADRLAGLKTAGLVSGYRGSPLGGFDQELWCQKALLADFDVRFEPGLNEDLGATMLWGAQQLDAFPGKRVEGAYSMWYGKGPGVDRTGDVFRNANMLGTARHGGVLAVAGDDHAAQSSMFPHQTDHVFEGAMMPILFPATVAEYIEYGLTGYALSRFSGLWVGFKAITETVESGRSMSVGRGPLLRLPEDIAVPAQRGFNYDPQLRWPAERAELERRVLEERLPAALAFMRANPLDRALLRPAQARVGIVTVGKAHADVLAAFEALGLASGRLEQLGIGLYKVGMIWPLETEGLKAFARGMQALFVVEEKRSFVERQIKEALFNVRADERPSVHGKTLGEREPLLPAAMEFAPEQLAHALQRFFRHVEIDVPPVAAGAAYARLGAPRVIALAQAPQGEPLTRKPFFCAGCPHNTSTRLPEGSHAAAGIGCHIMALGEAGNTATFCQMGGEGVQWVGMSTFTDMPHLFVNLGDGTYQHSGSLAIRQAVAARANVTYKILFNDAVAMTGGQPAEGGLTVHRVVAQVQAEGVNEVAVVTDRPEQYKGSQVLPAGVTLLHRDALDALQRRLREQKGVSVIVYDQTCAAEKRRRRKRGKLIDPPARVVINPAVCEGCGDCSVQSNCIAIEPLETELGRKRAINQSSCNKDTSCVKGFCPSFVTVEGMEPKRPDAARIQRIEAELRATLAPPARVPQALEHHLRMVVTGVGGTGVVTIGAILAMAAHLEGRGASTLDFTGLAQKNGAVLSHVQIAQSRGLITTSRIGAHAANVLLGCDAVVAASSGALSRLPASGARAIVNERINATADFVRDGDLPVSKAVHQAAIERAMGADGAVFWDCTAAAEAIFGDAIAANMMMVGYAYQSGLVPLSEASILRAIGLNGAAVTMNERAFLWGRLIAQDARALERVTGVDAAAANAPFDLARFVAERERDLAQYQNAAYAKRYRALVDAVAQAERGIEGASGELAQAAARHYFKVLAYKDEYEVARLHTDGGFGAYLSGLFDGTTGKKTFHMAPPLLTRRDARTGRRNKIALRGVWAEPLLRVLKHGKALRGTPFDPFARQRDRVIERAMIGEFEDDVRVVLGKLTPQTLAAAVGLLGVPGAVRGFGIVKERNYERSRSLREQYRAELAGKIV
ncbi:indolepyruvate ferredoxin oxidoreductase family protein [Paraburkholderia silvatlantica]|uniref:indolepyruvate ferredoxin oxidoreductase family protein n=1 Tax=Paraburkholderia silvatlantica TaxID=321895 RepID=UPI0010EC3CFB|nr:indolepyruvate ferredoxin oxidoreductase family protein [Paraburkholderia silvatlantica]TDQ80685.1 indolepyruvate ferredoxin oxidoreductase [Paraburkholderia silvatlantica]